MAIIGFVVIMAGFSVMIVDSTPSPIASTLSPISQTTTNANHAVTIYNISFNVTVNNNYNENMISVTNITKLINVSINEYLNTIPAERYQLLSIHIFAINTDQSSLFITDVSIELDSDDIPLINENDLFQEIERHLDYKFGKNVLMITNQMTTTTAVNSVIEYSFVETHSQSDIILMITMISICIILTCICIAITLWCIKSVYKQEDDGKKENGKEDDNNQDKNDLSRNDSFELSICQNTNILAAMQAKQLKIKPLDTTISPKQYGEKGIETPGKGNGTPYHGQEEGVEKNIHIINPYNNDNNPYDNDDNPSCSDSERVYQNTFTAGMTEREKYAIDDNSSYDMPPNVLENVEPAHFHTPASSTEYGDV